MADNDSTVPEPKTCRIDICNSNNIMVNLWERTSHTLTNKEWEWFAGATEQAEMSLMSLKQTIESIGCMVMHDANLKGVAAGNFQSGHDVPDLLLTIANQLENIQGLVHIGSSADARLKNPECHLKSDQIC